MKYGKPSAMFDGATSLLCAYLATASLINYTNNRQAVLQAELAKEPHQITQQVYESAKQSADRVSKGDLYTGAVLAAGAGLVGFAALYRISRRKEE